MTTTHTFTVVRYADPYLICTGCGERAEGYVHAPGHEEHFENWPCRHRAVIHSLCPSWSPVDGCRCIHVFNHVGHRTP